MSVEILDGATISSFIEDGPAFNDMVEKLFHSLDGDHDGRLFYSELVDGLRCMRGFEEDFGDDRTILTEETESVYDGLFARFNHDGSGVVSLEDFRVEIKSMMLAMADGLGFMPVEMVLEEGSFFKAAVERESAKLAA